MNQSMKMRFCAIWGRMGQKQSGRGKSGRGRAGVEGGARQDLEDKGRRATPLGWAEHELSKKSRGSSPVSAHSEPGAPATGKAHLRRTLPDGLSVRDPEIGGWCGMAPRCVFVRFAQLSYSAARRRYIQ